MSKRSAYGHKHNGRNRTKKSSHSRDNQDSPTRELLMRLESAARRYVK